MCSCGARGSMYMIWCSHLKALWHTDIGGSLVVQGSFLFYTEKCIMMACPKSAKRALSAMLPRAVEKAPYLNLHCCRW